MNTSDRITPEPDTAYAPAGEPAYAAAYNRPAGARNGATAADDEPGIGELFKRLRDDTQTLFRQEVRLATVEISDKVSRLTKNVVALAAGAICLALAGLGLLIVLSFALASLLHWIGVPDLMATALGFLIVTLITGGMGALALKRGLSDLKKQTPVPEETVQSLKEDAQWLKNRIK